MSAATPPAVVGAERCGVGAALRPLLVERYGVGAMPRPLGAECLLPALRPFPVERRRSARGRYAPSARRVLFGMDVVFGR